MHTRFSHMSDSARPEENIFIKTRRRKIIGIMVVDAISNYDEMVSIEKNKINFEKRKRTKEISNQHIFIF